MYNGMNSTKKHRCLDIYNIRTTINRKGKNTLRNILYFLFYHFKFFH